ncbi:uncharacterized protein LOC128036197 [Gossypium raimondii]|uniref:uncharacterized protein LOC128036197 n=1 Tax=Gossypium raimondii TaxID=29730 RepID=UPI00227D5505|nr:uncharacterized protein LOC128036197 [Gossypium raimondii]
MSGEMIESAIRSRRIDVRENNRRFIKMGVVKIDDSSGTKNPLPNHTDAGVNMMGESMGRKVKKVLLRCEEFRALVQSLMDNREVEFFEEVEGKGSVCASELATRIPMVNHPVIIISNSRVNEVRAQVMPKIVIQKSTKFSYKDSKKVPWNYECDVTVSGKEALVSVPKENQKTGSYANDEMYRSRINAQAESAEGEVLTAEQKEQRPFINELINEEEAIEFLRFLKHSEYSMIEQLHKQPTRISVLALLMSSEVHRHALMKALNEAYVASDISVNQLDRLVNNISADNFIFFNDDEIPSRGIGSTKALHITGRCKGSIVSGVLIDNGSALNVLPLSTLNRLPVDSSHMKTCQNVVRAFDRTERKVLGRIEIPLQTGPNTYEVDFIKLKLVTKGRLVTINAEEGIIASITSNAPYMETDEEVVECPFRTLEFVNATFNAEESRIPEPNIF